MAKKADKLMQMFDNNPLQEDKSDVILHDIFGSNKDEYRLINIFDITLNPANDYATSDTQETIMNLAADIKRNGLLHNIVVSLRDDGQYVLLSGERRLKAYRYLFEVESLDKYKEIYAQVRTGLTIRQEMLILDSANLSVRSGSGDEKKARKAVNRFVANIRDEYGVDTTSAIAVTEEVSGGIGRSAIYSNLNVEDSLSPELLEMLDNGNITKKQAEEFAKLDVEIQSIIYKSLIAAQKKGKPVFKQVGQNLIVSAKKHQKLTQDYEKQKDLVDRYNSDVNTVKSQIAMLKKNSNAATLAEEHLTQAEYHAKIAQTKMLKTKELIENEKQEMINVLSQNDSFIASAKICRKELEDVKDILIRVRGRVDHMTVDDDILLIAENIKKQMQDILLCMNEMKEENITSLDN